VDASRLSFPLQVLIFVVSTALSCALAVYGTQWSLKSDLRDLSTRIEMRDKDYQKDIATLQREMEAVKKGVNMATTVVNEMRVALAERGIRIKQEED
jgi:hypothetical protein